MSVARLNELLKQSALIFARLDKFDDAHEGWLSVEIVRNSLDRIEAELGIDQRHVWTDMLTNPRFNGRKDHAASCWFIQEQDSAMMWERYGRGGVAIRSTIAQLTSALIEPQDFELIFGEVHYGRWPNAPYSAKAATFWKDARYKEEREFRALISKAMIPGVGYSALQIEEFTPIRFDPAQAIQEVLVCPKYLDDQRFGDQFGNVASTILRAGLKCSLSKSTIGEKPDYEANGITVPAHFHFPKTGA
jgi:hypothetical protein